MGQEITKRVAEIALALLGDKTGDNVEKLITNNEKITSQTVLTRKDMLEKAGQLFDIISQDKNTIKHEDVRRFLSENPECLPMLGFEFTRSKRLVVSNGFGDAINKTADHEFNREEFKQAIGNEANNIAGELIGVANASAVTYATEISIPVYTAGEFLANAYTKAHPNLQGHLTIPEEFIAAHDLDHNLRLDIEELRMTFKDISAQSDKYFKPAKPQELQNLNTKKEPEIR